MKKLAFGYAGAGSFEMPRLQPVNLEKDSHIAFALPTSVYKGTGSSFDRNALMKAASQQEIDIIKKTASVGGGTGA